MSPSAPSQQNSEALLAEIIEDFTNRVQAGESVAIEAFIQQHPEQAERLRQLLPALALLDDLGRSRLPAADGALRESREGTLSGVLGDFRIVREVGKGGMGVVYEAQQISLRRRVALKVLPFAATMDPRHLQRFHNEAQAAACLHHTNIVPVHFVGSERGVHFYAMQFIDGQPLSDLIRQLRGQEQKTATPGLEQTTAYQGSPEAAASTPRPAGELTPWTGEDRRGRDYYRKVAELGVQAAEALDHAHQLGIVHRDIKPGNLLLDGRGNLWVTDFGLAHMQQSEASLTVTGQAVGTPRYMSPEQAQAQRVPIDHRTDVYSLGATLYELLTLRPAFPSEDRQELFRQIASEEPAKPRRLERGIPAELEIIVLKAMEKRPQDRYGTAKELADDLERWLKNEPIRARWPGIVQRAAKWGRRHRPLVVTVALCLFVALVMLALSNLVIWHEHERTKEALRLMRLHRDEVNNQAVQLGKIRHELELKIQHSLEAMDGLLRRLEETHPREGTEAMPIHSVVYDQALNFYQDLLPLERHSVPLHVEIVWAYVHLGNLHALHNQFIEAAQAYANACENAPGAFAAHPANNASMAQAEADDWKEPQEIKAKRRERPEVEKAYRRALAHWRKTSPKDLSAVQDYRLAIYPKPRTNQESIRLYERVMEDLPTPAHLGNLVRCYTSEGKKLKAEARVEDAKAAFRQAVKHAEKGLSEPACKEDPHWANLALELTCLLSEIVSQLQGLDASLEKDFANEVGLCLYEQGIRSNLHVLVKGRDYLRVSGFLQNNERLDKERARLRQKALDRLQGELEVYRRHLERSPIGDGPEIAQLMQDWFQDADFAGVRGAESLAKLPEPERKEWQKLWQEVEVLRQRYAEQPTKASSARP